MKSILINVMLEETRLAMVDDGELEFIEVERASHDHLVGNIYKGKVQNVLPGMQAAFVDIGTEKNAFMYIGNGKLNESIDAKPSDKIHIGQRICMQITKDAVGLKGPRGTMHLSLPGKYLVLMPTVSYVGLSRRIEDKNERERLTGIAARIRPDNMGVILRTASIDVSEDILQKEINSLIKIWQAILARYELNDGKKRNGSLLYRDADMVIRIIRDNFDDSIDKLIIDDKETYERARNFINILVPELVDRVVYYEEKTPLFKKYNIEDEIEKIGQRQIELKSGGFIVIDKTEALTAIDVNTGKYVGNSNLAETAFRLNIEAAAEIMKQIRLRDIGGIIIIDFIDMEKEGHKETLLEYLRMLTARDRTKMSVVDITALGLVEITRKKSRANFESIIYSTCPVCQGRGRIESPETVGIKISRDIRRMESSQHAKEGYEIVVHESVAEELRQNQLMLNLAAEYGTDIKVAVDSSISPESYSILQQS